MHTQNVVVWDHMYAPPIAAAIPFESVTAGFIKPTVDAGTLWPVYLRSYRAHMQSPSIMDVAVYRGRVNGNPAQRIK